LEDITKMRSNKGKVLMLIVPVILLVIMIFIYRYVKNNTDDNKPSVTISPTPASMRND